MLVLNVKSAVSLRLSISNLDSASIPLSLSFSFPQLRIGIDITFKILFENSDHNYMLAAVIYYANHHFTAQVIMRDGRIWFYNGMELADLKVQPCFEHVGFIHRQDESELDLN